MNNFCIYIHIYYIYNGHVKTLYDPHMVHMKFEFQSVKNPFYIDRKLCALVYIIKGCTHQVSSWV